MDSGKIIGYRLGALFAVLSLVCAIIVYAAPDFAPSILEYLTHSTWQFTIRPFNIIEVFIGAGLWAIIGLLVGFVFSGICNCIKCNPKK